MTLRIILSHGLATVQDLGRPGYQRYGISPSGAMDWYAHRAANLLVGNHPDAAGVEVGLADLTLLLTEDALLSVTGAGYSIYVQDRPMPLWTTLFVRAGWIVELRKTMGGAWAYLAVAGGVQTPPVLGSQATYLRGGFGGFAGRPLQSGDVLPTGHAIRSPLPLAGTKIRPEQRPVYDQTPVVEAILGPQAEAFTSEGLQTFLSATYLVSTLSDRMGYRLEGETIAHRAGADIVSDGLALGSIQIPANGQPLVMMSDRPTTGGYTKIATVTTADLPLLAQCTPGASYVRFRSTTVEAAQARYRRIIQALNDSLEAPETDCLSY